MSALIKSLVLCSVLCFAMVTSLAFAVKIDLPKDAIILEADAGEMEKGVTIVDEKDASEGKATDHERGVKTEYEIDIPKAGDWYLWIRISCPDGGKDSYWIGIDKATPNPAEDALGEQAVRIYSAAGDSVNTKDQPFNIWFWDFGKSNADPPPRLGVSGDRGWRLGRTASTESEEPRTSSSRAGACSPQRRRPRTSGQLTAGYRFEHVRKEHTAQGDRRERDPGGRGWAGLRRGDGAPGNGPPHKHAYP